MKIQNLAVIAIIIILPMAIILNSYFDNQIKTINLQIEYDKKLNNATYDAIKSFQLNMTNSDVSNFADSKMSDIRASINTFYKSLSSNFNMSGYGESVLQNYVPAIVYTLYDGYYIYSAYDNTLDVKTTSNPDGDTFSENATYKDGEKIYGLKPYIYYSCRYKPNSNSDFIITYSLDSYITIQGKVNGDIVNRSGYLLTGVSEDGSKYADVDILNEYDSQGLKQWVYMPGSVTASDENKREVNLAVDWPSPGSLVWFPYKKTNGTKNYKDEDDNVFTSTNDEIRYKVMNANEITENNDGIEYYKLASDFSKWVSDNLGNLSTYDAVDQNGNSYQDESFYPKEKNPPFQIKRKIFSELKNKNNGKAWLEEQNSQFNAHRIEVIKNSIESNLIAAISNYNNFSTSDVNFAMPRLQDYEWEQVTENISVITFLQGLSIGGKVYNGHSIIRNDLTEDYVSEDSIYIANHSNNIYYNVKDKNLIDDGVWSDNLTGLLNTDFERRTSSATAEKVDEKLTKNIYYYPREETGSYSSIISNYTENKTIFEYLKDGRDGKYGSGNIDKYLKLSQVYYTALGRERYEMYKTNRSLYY